MLFRCCTTSIVTFFPELPLPSPLKFTFILSISAPSFFTSTFLPIRLRCSASSMKSSSCFYYSPRDRVSHVHVKALHGNALKLGFLGVQCVRKHILSSYLRCRGVEDACKLFDESQGNDKRTLNLIITGLARSNKNGALLAFSYFKTMMLTSMDLEGRLMNGLILACNELDDTITGRSLHCIVVKQGVGQNGLICTALVDFYGKRGLVGEARKMFGELSKRDLVLWNVIINSYVLNELYEKALEMYTSMQKDGFRADAFTYSSLLKASTRLASIELGNQIHSAVVKLCCQRDFHVASSLVDMYSKSGKIKDACKCLDGIQTKNVVCWNAMIVGYGQNGDVKEAMKIFRQMINEGFRPDEFTLASVLSSCGNTSLVWEIMQAHALVIKTGLESFPTVINSLIHAHSKIGNFANALLNFASAVEPDIVSWTSMINAFAYHGFGKQCIEIFYRMIHKAGITPDGVAFLGVLSACSHAGLVNQGLRCFNVMVKDYRIKPNSKHFACLVDLLSRGDHLEEASEILVSLDTCPDALAAFYSACNIHGYREMAIWAAKKLVELEPNKPVNRMLLSNIYSSAGKWLEAAEVRATLGKGYGLKATGQSWIETTEHT